MRAPGWLSKNRRLLSVLIALLGWGAVLYFVPPDALVTRVGIGNGYIVAFVVTLLAGFSIFTGTAAYATVIELARGGADPLILGLVAGTGLFLSDSAFYLLLLRGRGVLSSRFGRWLSRFHHFMEHLPTTMVYMGVYLFCAFGPIPNDVIIAVLIIGGYEYKKVWPALLAGDITFMLFLSYIFYIAT